MNKKAGTTKIRNIQEAFVNYSGNLFNEIKKTKSKQKSTYGISFVKRNLISFNNNKFKYISPRDDLIFYLKIEPFFKKKI